MKNKRVVTARLYAIRGLMVIQTFCPAQTAVLADRKEARKPLLHIASTVRRNFKTTDSNNTKKEYDNNRQLFRQPLHTPKQLVESCCSWSK